MSDQSAKFYSLILIFFTLCVVDDLMFQRKLSRRPVIITFIYFVSHASALASRSITFTQRFRTTRHLTSIQLLWKPKILSVKDKKLNIAKEILINFQNYANNLWHERKNAFLARFTPAFWEFFWTKRWIFDTQIKVDIQIEFEEKGLLRSRWFEKIFQVKFTYFVCELTEYIL